LPSHRLHQRLQEAILVPTLSPTLHYFGCYSTARLGPIGGGSDKIVREIRERLL
jgi:hypothetical protein